jgi:hypothetical protein
VLCYDSRTDCTSCPSANSGGHCARDCNSSQRNFYTSCGAYNETVVLGHNSLGYTFGGYAMARWQEPPYYIKSEAVHNFLFRFQPGPAKLYRPTDTNTNYQMCNPAWWPWWGSAGEPHFYDFKDLCFGMNGVLGAGGICDQGNTYEGAPNETCGGLSNWGVTEMEVWYRVCASTASL